MIKIEKYVHHCVDHNTGNKHEHEVASYEYKYQEHCYVCGEELVTTRALLAHIYRELAE
jgi:hypothetical protein